MAIGERSAGHKVSPGKQVAPFDYPPGIDTYECIKMLLMLPVALCRILCLLVLLLSAGVLSSALVSSPRW